MSTEINREYPFLWEPFGGLESALFTALNDFDDLLSQRAKESDAFLGGSLLRGGEVDVHSQLKDQENTASVQRLTNKGIRSEEDLGEHNRLVCLVSKKTRVKRTELRSMHIDLLRHALKSHTQENGISQRQLAF